MGIETEENRFVSVTSQGCNIFSSSSHISHVYSAVKHEVGINIFAKCVVLNITCSTGIEVHIDRKYSIAEKGIKTVTLDTT